MPDLARWIILIIQFVGSMAGVFAFAHALMQRPDAYTAADRMSKPTWLAITGGSTAAMFLFGFLAPFLIFWLAGLVATLVYLVDVRPKLIEVQGGRRW